MNQFVASLFAHILQSLRVLDWEIVHGDYVVQLRTLKEGKLPVDL